MEKRRMSYQFASSESLTKFSAITPTTDDNQYDTLIDLTNIQSITKPPITMSIPLEELMNFSVPDFPCHNQAAESCIKLVTDASQKVVGKERRHGYIVNTMYSRSINGEINSKRDYTVANIDEILKMKASLKKRKYQ